MDKILKNRTLNNIAGFLIAVIVGFFLYSTYSWLTSKPAITDEALLNKVDNVRYQRIVLAGGCFWSLESAFDHVDGVLSAVSGYADVDKVYELGEGPGYEEISSGDVSAREAVEVIYDTSKISTKKILEIYFRNIDPTDNEGAFVDRGYQYTPAIYYTNKEQYDTSVLLVNRIDESKLFSKPVIVKVYEYNNFYPAEEYHQNYKDKNPLRYSLYRDGSGRNSFSAKYWSDSNPVVGEIFGDEKINIKSETQSETSTVGTTGNTVQPWKLFTTTMKEEKIKTLTSLQYMVMEREGTEPPFRNEYYDNEEKGIYVDRISGEPLFLSIDKYDSGTGWPSFVKPINESYITLHVDTGLLEARTEVRSKIADSHLGHVFPDGPEDRGGKRYCMNSASLLFIPLQDMEKRGYGEFLHYFK